MRQLIPNNLLSYISNKQWSNSEKELRGNTSLASSVRFVDGVTRGTQHYGCIIGSNYNGGEHPLSTALRMNAPGSLILALLKAYGNAASEKDEDGLFPVDLAVNSEYSDKVLCALFRASNDDSFPAFSAELHARLMTLVTAEGSKNLPLELIHAVILGYKNVLNEANSFGLLPLHVSLSSKRDDEVILFLLEESSEASAIIAKTGDLPIHVAALYGCSLEVLQSLINAYPGGLAMNNGDGLLPLHVALSSNRGYEMIHSLIKKNPRATAIATSNGDLPIHIAFQKRLQTRR